MEGLGRLAFYAGVVISILLGWMDMTYASYILVALGIVVGLLNVTAGEAHRFLLSTLVLVTAGLALTTTFGDPLQSILQAFVAFTAAAAVVVAFKEVWAIEKGR